MTRLVLVVGKRLVCGAMAAAALAAVSAPVCAAEIDYEYKPALKIDTAKRYFVRVGYTYAKPNDKYDPVKDLSGPVLKYNELSRYIVSTGPTVYQSALNTPLPGVSLPALSRARLGLARLDTYMGQDAANRGVDPNTLSLGTPNGVSQHALGAGTPTVSLGIFLDEEQKWAAEAYVLALPIKNKLVGKGRIGTASPNVDYGDDMSNYANNKAVSDDLGEVASTQMMPPMALLHRYFGGKNDRLRASLGLGMLYAIFFDTKASPSMEAYVGGPTKVKIKNTFGAGPFLGAHYAFGDGWSLHGTLGYVYLKTKATLTTDVDPAMMATSVASYQAALDLAPDPSNPDGGNAQTLGALVFAQANSAMVPTLQQVAKARAALYGGNPNSLGTYVREITGKLNPWVLNVSVGYEF